MKTQGGTIVRKLKEAHRRGAQHLLEIDVAISQTRTLLNVLSGASAEAARHRLKALQNTRLMAHEANVLIEKRLEEAAAGESVPDLLSPRAVESTKGTLQRVIHWFGKMVLDESRMKYDLDHAPDPIAARLHSYAEATNAKVESPYHRDTGRTITRFALWTTMMDSAWRHQRDDLVRQIVRDADWWRENLPEHDPASWHVNLASAHLDGP